MIAKLVEEEYSLLQKIIFLPRSHPTPIILKLSLFTSTSTSHSHYVASISHLTLAIRSNISCIRPCFFTQQRYLIGDFNMLDIDWDTLSSAAYPSVLFCNFIFNNNHSQLIDKPTHNKGNILDLILTNACRRVQDITISAPIAVMSLTQIIQLSPSL